MVRAYNREWEGEKAKKSVERREKIGTNVKIRSLGQMTDGKETVLRLIRLKLNVLDVYNLSGLKKKHLPMVK